MDVVTLQGQPVSILGLAGNQNMEVSCVPLAFKAGVNYFFYNLSFSNLLDGLKPLLTAFREELVVATGSENRDRRGLSQYLDKVRRYLNTDVVDVFFAEYVSPYDELASVQAVLDELHTWKEKGLIRYVGATVHNRPLALELISSGQCEVLMHRSNMAHRKAEKEVLSCEASNLHLLVSAVLSRGAPGAGEKARVGGAYSFLLPRSPAPKRCQHNAI